MTKLWWLGGSRSSMVAVALCLAACGGDDGSPDPSGAGGSAGTGGSPSTGGSSSGTGGSVTGGGGSMTGSGGTSSGTGGSSSGGSSSGGSSSGGSSSGGAAGSAGAPSSGGAAGAGSAGAPGSGGTGGGERCVAATSDFGVVNETIVVEAGETFDGECQRFIAGSALGDGSQDEGQLPVFRLEDGARLVNVVLGAPAADGIHTYGDVTLENVIWEDIGEDALTIKESGTVVLDGGSATNGEDKVFQVNAASTFRISNFTASHAGKFIRQNGGTDFKVDVFIDNCDISHMDEAVFRTDSDSSTVTMTNTRYSNIGDALFIGVDESNITTSNNTEY